MTVTIFDDEKIKLIKDTICKGATDDELSLFLHVCKKTGLDPMLKQIYSIKRGNQRTIQTSIDGLRVIAERTGKYAPGEESTFTYDEKKRLHSATAFVKKMTPDGTWHTISSIAFMAEYCPDQNMGLWRKLPHVMLSKCAEANALRRAFPAEMSGLYSEEEMDQAEVGEISKPEIKKIVKEEGNLSELQVEQIKKMVKGHAPAFKEYLDSLGYDKLADVPARLFGDIVEHVNTKILEV